MHEADPALDKTPGEKTAASVGVGHLLADAIVATGLLGFFVEVEDLAGFQLHAGGETVGLYAGVEFEVTGTLFLMIVIELVE